MQRDGSPPDTPEERYAFGAFRLDLQRGALYGPGGEIRLRPKSWEVLCYLVRHHGRLVSRDELFDAVWGRTVVTDDSLTQCLVELRRAIGDHERAIIRTVPRRGCVFAGQVTRDGTPVEPQALPVAPAPGTSPATGAGRGRSWRAMTALLALVTFVAAAWWLSGPRGGAPWPARPVAPPALANSIAVLPFADMSAGRDQEYIGDGIAEEILNLLARSADLKVIARTSSFSFKDRALDIPAIAAKLGVAHVLEGSVRMSGNRIRVTAQLVTGRDGIHVWSQTYDRELDDLLDVQTDIATAVAEVLNHALRPAGSRDSRHDPRAYDHFLRASFLFQRRDPGDLDRAREHLEAAVDIDPGYAAAWAQLAGVYNVLIHEAGESSEAARRARRDAAERALALDPTLPEAHLRAIAVHADEGEFGRARQHMEIARSLDPGNELLLGLTAGRLLAQGRVDDALLLSASLRERDPLSRVVRFNHANMLMGVGRLDEARAELLAARELGSGRAGEIDALLAQIAVLEHHHHEALALAEALEPGLPRDLALALAFQALGRDAEAAAAVARLEENNSPQAAIALAELCTARSDYDGAFAWLGEASARFKRLLAWGDLRLAQLAHVSPHLRPLHDDPRWQALFEEIRQAML